MSALEKEMNQDVIKNKQVSVWTLLAHTGSDRRGQIHIMVTALARGNEALIRVDTGWGHMTPGPQTRLVPIVS